MESVLGWRSPNYVYQPAGCKKVKLLLKNRRLSDEIAVRFSDIQGSEYPLLADNYADRIHAMDDAGDVINLFVEYGIFGEREREERGIFDFMRSLPDEILKHPDFMFRTPAEIAKNLDPVAQLDVRDDIASPGAENNLHDWTGNSLQKDAVTSLYSMEAKLRRRKDRSLLHTWRLLQEAENFHCMHTGKRAEDGGMGTFSNPYGSPYDAYINYMNIIDDFSGMLGKRRSSNYEGA
jgi:alpha-amylase